MRKISLFVATFAFLFVVGTSFTHSQVDVDASLETNANVREVLYVNGTSTTNVRVTPVTPLPNRPLTEEEREERMAEAQERRDEFEMRRAEMEQTMRERREMAQENRSDVQVQVATRKAENTLRVMSATVERLEKIADRIDSRIEKLKSAGGDTAESEGFLAEARVDLANAEASLEVLVSIDLSGESFQENFQRIRAVAVEAKGHIRSAHENLMNAVRLLGQVEAGVRVDATVESN